MSRERGLPLSIGSSLLNSSNKEIPAPDNPETDPRPYALPALVDEGTAAPELLRLDLIDESLGGERPVIVALPPADIRPGRRFRVVYMQDGQNLFDPATSFAGDWQLGSTLAHHARVGLYVIVIAVYNGHERRLDEYSPFVDPIRGGGGAGRYLEFLTDRLKPLIDRTFPTLPGREFTSIAGSSLGGLFSLYAHFQRPDIFGSTAVLSPALWFADHAIHEYISDAPAVGGRIYLDAGSDEGPDELVDTRRLRDQLLARGYRLDDTLRYVEEEGAEHHESRWAARFRRALPFILGA
jgi:predicted alpha/beta superfamily hydrolase